MDPLQFTKSSILSSSSNSLDGICRICHSKEEPESRLISPCLCTGSLGYVHSSCLQHWIKCSKTTCCEICKFDFIMHKKINPFRKQEKLQMAPSEKVKVRLHIIIHVVAITCIVWFTYILINRSLDRIDTWSICERLAILFVVLSEIAFISLHCEMYEQLFRRWRDSITVIKVQSMPDKDKRMQQQQRELTEFMADSKLTSNAEENEDNEQLTLDEDEFRSCQTHNNNRINVEDGKIIPHKISTTDIRISCG